MQGELYGTVFVALFSKIKFVNMCKYLLVLAIFTITNMVAAQTIVKGSFKSLPNTSFKMVTNESVANSYGGETLTEGTTNENGVFNVSFSLKAEQPIMLFISNVFYRLWAIPNTSLQMEETADDKIIFSGAAAVENDFLYQSRIMLPMGVATGINSTTFEPQKQFNYLDSVEKFRWTLYDKLFSTKTVSKNYSSYCKGEISYFTFFYKNQYAQRYIWGANGVKKEDFPKNYFNFWEQFALLEDGCKSADYNNALRDYGNFKASERLHIYNEILDKEKYNATVFTILDSLLAKHPLTKRELKCETILFIMNYFDLPQLVETQLAAYKKEFPDTKHLSLLQNKWNAKVKNTATTIDFALKDNTGTVVNLKSLKGKVIYLDFWGSWCKACLQQVPNALKLQERFKNKEVAFLFIDFFDSKEQWLKAIKKHNIKGIHVKADKADEDYFRKTFGIDNGFPRYALIDKNGVLVTSSAPHPGDKDATTLIEKYLNK
jgi:thiol-disulfide isomerase/thioredoxin